MDEKKRIPVAEADGWIPVQEGLPKKSDYYLVTRGRKRITTMLYFTRGKWWSDSLCQDRWPDYMILAWQPRLKPYMGGADEFIPSISVDDAIEALREVKTAMQHYGIKAYLDEHGELPLKEASITLPTGSQSHWWIRNQTLILHQGRQSEDKVKLLNEIGIV